MTDQTPPNTLSDRIAALSPQARQSLAYIIGELEDEQIRSTSPVSQATLAFYPIVDNATPFMRQAWLIFAWLVAHQLLPVPDPAKDTNGYFPSALSMIAEVLDLIDHNAL